MIYLGKDPVGISNPKLSFPDNVHIASFALENDVSTNDVTIPNPFGSVKFRKVLCMRFSESAVEDEVIGFFANLTTVNKDESVNRKLLSHTGGIIVSGYFPLFDYTEETLTLRGNGGGVFPSGTYYIFAWDEEVTTNG